MITCGDNCVLCCDFCIHVIHEKFIDHLGEEVTSCPIGCVLHEDPEHQDIAEACEYCEDFHCFLANKE